MSKERYQEPLDELRDKTRELHRALLSLIEQLQTINWNQQRIDSCLTKELGDLLTNHLQLTKEKAAMLIEWLRRNDTDFEAALKKYLFSNESLCHDAPSN